MRIFSRLSVIIVCWTVLSSAVIGQERQSASSHIEPQVTETIQTNKPETINPFEDKDPMTGFRLGVRLVIGVGSVMGDGIQVHLNQELQQSGFVWMGAFSAEFFIIRQLGFAFEPAILRSGMRFIKVEGPVGSPEYNEYETQIRLLFLHVPLLVKTQIGLLELGAGVAMNYTLNATQMTNSQSNVALSNDQINPLGWSVVASLGFNTPSFSNRMLALGFGTYMNVHISNLLSDYTSDTLLWFFSTYVKLGFNIQSN
jgi:hypothetical protein